MIMSLRERLLEGGRRLSVVISDQHAEKLLKYLILLSKWSPRINLVGTTNDREIISRHVVDCMAVLPHLPFPTKTIIDVGSGAGLPGAIIAIFRPNTEVTALEPTHKKHAFLNTLRREIPLPNFHPRAMRVEELVAKEAPLFEAAVSRATFALTEWLELGRSLISLDGIVLGMEGSEQQPLPERASRHPYAIEDRTRAMIVYRP